MSFLLLGIDSLIACFAVGALVGRRSRLPYAALFGVCDAGAFLLGTALHWTMPEATAQVVSTAALVGLGLYLVVVAIGAQKVADTRWVWALPALLTLDNIGFGLIDHSWSSAVPVEAAEQALSSILLAAVGLAASAAVVRAIPQVHRNRVLTAGIAGAAMVVAGPLLLALD